MKNKLLKAISAVLALLTLTVSFAACEGAKGDTGTAGSEKENTSDTSENVSEPSGYLLNGRKIEDYTVYYAWRDNCSEKQCALDIAEKIKETTGVKLTVFSEFDGVGDCAIVVGASEHTVTAKEKELEEKEYLIDVSGTRICLLASSKYGFLQLADELCACFDGSKEITVGSTEKQSYADDIIETMTFNIYNWDGSDKHLTAICSVIKNFTPDTIGFQEITDTWVNKIMADDRISSMYAKVGKDRQDGTEEQSAIFYRKDKYRLVTSGTKWMYGSNETGSDIAGKIKSSLYNRVYTYVVLERISDGKRFAHINTHLDLTAEPYTERMYNCQIKQLSYALAMAEKLIAEQNVAAVAFTGDFNGKIGDPPCASILEAGFVRAETSSDKLVGSEVNDGKYTNNSNNEQKGICRYIDHVFIKGSAYLEEYEICSQKYDGNYPSDHIPRIARYILQ